MSTTFIYFKYYQSGMTNRLTGTDFATTIDVFRSIAAKPHEGNVPLEELSLLVDDAFSEQYFLQPDVVDQEKPQIMLGAKFYMEDSRVSRIIGNFMLPVTYAGSTAAVITGIFAEASELRNAIVYAGISLIPIGMLGIPAIARHFRNRTISKVHDIIYDPSPPETDIRNI